VIARLERIVSRMIDMVFQMKEKRKDEGKDVYSTFGTLVAVDGPYQDTF